MRALQCAYKQLMKAPAIRLVRAPKAGRLSPAVAGILAAFAAGQAQALPAGENITSGAASVEPVSYTHLTLPTNREV